MDMSLIAGMPEVIAYIRSQDERIKALKAELDDVKEELDDVKEENEKLKDKYEAELITQEEFQSNDEVINDINGKKMSVPTEEECQKMFGISKEEFIMLAQNSDCDYSNL